MNTREANIATMALLLRQYQIGYRCGFYEEGRPCGCSSCQLSEAAQKALDKYTESEREYNRKPFF